MPWKKGNRLRVVTEGEALGPTRALYAEIKRALGTPALSVFYPALGAYPQFLRLHWDLMRPVVSSGQFFACAERLRADAYTRAHNYLRILDLGSCLSDGDLGQLRDAIEIFNHKDSLLLLLFCLQIQAMEGPAGKPVRSSPPPHLSFPDPPALVEEAAAPAAIRHTYEEIRRVLELPCVNAEYRAMARYPEYLRAYWTLLKALLQSPLYQECFYGIREAAWNLARELPGPIELPIEQLLDAGLQEEEIASVARILELFVRNLSGLVMNVAIAKISLEGGNWRSDAPRVSPDRSERVA